jgi:hypothetical protein
MRLFWVVLEFVQLSQLARDPTQWCIEWKWWWLSVKIQCNTEIIWMKKNSTWLNKNSCVFESTFDTKLFKSLIELVVKQNSSEMREIVLCKHMTVIFFDKMMQYVIQFILRKNIQWFIWSQTFSNQVLKIVFRYFKRKNDYPSQQEWLRRPQYSVHREHWISNYLPICEEKCCCLFRDVPKCLQCDVLHIPTPVNIMNIWTNFLFVMWSYEWVYLPVGTSFYCFFSIKKKNFVWICNFVHKTLTKSLRTQRFKTGILYLETNNQQKQKAHTQREHRTMNFLKRTNRKTYFESYKRSLVFSECSVIIDCGLHIFLTCPFNEFIHLLDEVFL